MEWFNVIAHPRNLYEELLHRKLISGGSRILKTISGVPPITIADAIRAKAVSLSVALAPIQDLHGYDKPWSGGNGKNKLPPIATETKNGITLTNDNGQYTLNGTATAQANFDVAFETALAEGDYSISLLNSDTTSNITVFLITESGTGNPLVSPTTENKTLLINATQPLVRLRIRVQSGATLSNFKMSPILVSGTVAETTYSPYSNICPISGRTECVTEVCGKNLWNPIIYDGGRYGPGVGDIWTLTESATQFTQEGDTLFLTTSATWRYYTVLFEIKDATLSHYRNFTFTSSATGGVTEAYLDENFAVLWRSNSADATVVKSGVLSIPSGAKYYAVVITNRSTASTTLSLEAPQIELGSTASGYEQYTNDTYTTALGRTVYGGALDVVSGVLTVDTVFRNARDMNWSVGTNGGVQYFACTVSQLKVDGYRNKLWCNMFETVVTPYLNPSPDSTVTNAYARGQNVNVRCDSIATLADWNTFITNNDVEFVWAFAPQTYQLTPQEVALLKGTNNVWSDDAETLEIEYWGRADG